MKKIVFQMILKLAIFVSFFEIATEFQQEKPLPARMPYPSTEFILEPEVFLCRKDFENAIGTGTQSICNLIVPQMDNLYIVS